MVIWPVSKICYDGLRFMRQFALWEGNRAWDDEDECYYQSTTRCAL